MPHIEQLTPHVADLIAAGEVVERPASVVKELVENSIDAGATTVVVELQGGGMGSIRVTDNGCGIEDTEIATAFLRHATSKLRKADDLAAIGTLGFRGEALAAISAVSRVEIFSKTRGSQLGASLHLEGGKPGAVEPAGCPEGTTIMVRELFYNTPARLKFMKTDSAEASAVAAMLAQIALSHPEVSIRYIRDGKTELHTPGDGRLLSAIYAARGRDFAKSLAEVYGEGEGVKVFGYATLPLEGRGTRAMQTFFCCGRMIKSALLTAAVEEAYANRQMKGKYPGCVLHIELPLNQVDVNVHPAKTVVKFVNERSVFSTVHHAVSAALDQAGSDRAAPKAPPLPTGKPPAAAPPASTVAASAPRRDFYQTMDAKTFRESQMGQAKPQRPAPPTAASPELERPRRLRDSAVPIFNGQPLVLREAAPPPIAAPPREAAVEKSVESPMEPPLAEEPEQATLLPQEKPPWRYVGEVLDTYIIAQDGDDVYLIDKHAAHERIHFDRMKQSAEPLMSQQLLSPMAVDLPPQQGTALLENLPLLEQFGFGCEDFGGGCVMVRAIPAELDMALARDALEELAEALLKKGGADPASARDAMLHTMACKAAIKGGQRSDPAELKALIRQVESGEVQFCPHGRPVKIKLTKYEIEKMFKRA